MLIGLGFGIYFTAHGDWAKAGIEASLLLAGVSAALLTRGGHLRLAALILSGFAFFAILFVVTFQDLPSERVPRTVHHYFMVLGVGMMMLFRHDSRWLRLGVPVTCFVATLFFASTQWGIRTALVDPDGLRAVGAWIHSGFALTLVVALIYVMQADLSSQRSITVGLRHAIARQQLQLYYQAQVDARGALVGAEALLRWHHPEEGMVSPADFIPVAESTGMIVPIGHWVLGTACAQLVAWSQRPETAHLTLSVNVSAQQFKQSDFVTQVVSVLQRSGANAHRLKLELTESSLVNDVDDITTKMKQLQGHGLQLSLDDFGTGYSSLGYLQKLPIHELKIDESFVRNVAHKAQDATLARSIVQLAHDLHLEVIAEGVETVEQHNFLLDIGCQKFQGYLFGRPMPVESFNQAANQWRETQNASL